VATIREQRRQIRRLQSRSPRFTDRYIQDTLWDDCYAGGRNEAAAEMNREHIEAVPLSWDEVFEIPDTKRGAAPCSRLLLIQPVDPCDDMFQGLGGHRQAAGANMLPENVNAFGPDAPGGTVPGGRKASV